MSRPTGKREATQLAKIAELEAEIARLEEEYDTRSTADRYYSLLSAGEALLKEINALKRKLRRILERQYEAGNTPNPITPNPLLPYGTIYLSGVRTPELDKLAAANLENANWTDEVIPLGILVQPLTAKYLNDGPRYYKYLGIDNGCFTEIGRERFRMDSYLRLIAKGLEQYGDLLLFATAPDVPYDWEATLEKSLPTLPILRGAGAPAAICVQDGATPANVPWSELDCIFIGGSTEWKESAVARAITREAIKRHKWVHMGRVNSMPRMRLAMDFGCGSVDGTTLLYPKTGGTVANLLEWLRDVWKNDPQRLYAAAHEGDERAIAELDALVARDRKKR